MATKYNVSTAQLLLRYSIQKGYMPVIKATNVDHLHSNIRAEDFVLAGEDLTALDSKDKGIAGSLCT
jgi:diketogulonate reductase-like aldo/keto reductase